MVAGASPWESMRWDSPMPREEGVIVQMEREAEEAGLGGWFNRMLGFVCPGSYLVTQTVEDQPPLQVISTGDASHTQDGGTPTFPWDAFVSLGILP